MNLTFSGRNEHCHGWRQVRVCGGGAGGRQGGAQLRQKTSVQPAASGLFCFGDRKQPPTFLLFAFYLPNWL